MSNDLPTETVAKILRNRHNIIREGVNIYKCLKCEATQAGKSSLRCEDRNCRGEMVFHKRIPQSRVEEITSRRAARQCPVCMKMFYVWVETCPYCSARTLKGKITNKERDIMAKLYDYQFTK